MACIRSLFVNYVFFHAFSTFQYLSVIDNLDVATFIFINGTIDLIFILVIVVLFQRRRLSAILYFITFVIALIFTLQSFSLLSFYCSFFHSLNQLIELRIFNFLIFVLFFHFRLFISNCTAIHGALHFCLPFVQILHNFEIDENS